MQTVMCGLGQFPNWHGVKKADTDLSAYTVLQSAFQDP